MIYTVSAGISIYVRSAYVKVDVATREEAETAARALGEELKKGPFELEPNIHVSEDESNFLYDVGGIYLFKRYSTPVPVKCIESRNHWRRPNWRHTFRALNSNFLTHEISLKGKKPHTKIIQQLCKDGKLSDTCTDCPAKFVCLTLRQDE
jgi:hypothetical protein